MVTDERLNEAATRLAWRSLYSVWRSRGISDSPEVTADVAAIFDRVCYPRAWWRLMRRLERRSLTNPEAHPHD